MTPCATCQKPVDTRDDPDSFVTECGTVVECKRCREGEREQD